MRNSHRPITRRCTLAAVLTASLAMLGCGGKKVGPTLFTVSGKVTFDGKPVPVGFVTFEPDTSQQNAGPGCGAAIKNGYYETETNKGVTGGPYRITVTGSDGIATILDGEDAPQGASLFPPYKTKFDLPKADTTWDIEVPVAATAASN
jgi:hypothetical protein